MKKEKIEHSIPINECFKTFDRSFNRLKYFSCLASNLDFEKFPEIWGIQNTRGLTYEVQPLQTQEEKQNILHGYKHFIHLYLVRDCIESFAISLDHIIFALLINGKEGFLVADPTLDELLSDEEKKLLKKFERSGLEGKIKLLKERFKVELMEDNEKIISGLNQIRNCLSHNNGLVRKNDGEQGIEHHRKFTWKTISIVFKGNDTGNEFYIKPNETYTTLENGWAWPKIENRDKSFKIDQPLYFTPAESYEIAYSLNQVAIILLNDINKKSNLVN